MFKRAINVNGLALTEYMDWYVDGKSLGKMLFWGFTISGRPAEVMERLRPLIKDEERLRKDGAGFMRAEVKIAQSPWVPAIVNSGAAAGLNKVERTLMIDLDESKNEVTVMCSLQGGLTAAVLKEVRPDMAERSIRANCGPPLSRMRRSPRTWRRPRSPSWRPARHGNRNSSP